MAAMLLCCCSSDSEVKAEVPDNAGKTLVVYYSYTGNCREIVNTLRRDRCTRPTTMRWALSC